MKAQTFPLPVRCPSCRTPLTALVAPSQFPLKDVSWKCPSCRTSQTSDFGGLLIWVRLRIPQENPRGTQDTHAEDGLRRPP